MVAEAETRASGPVPRGRFSRAVSVRIAREEIVSGPQQREGFELPGLVRVRARARREISCRAVSRKSHHVVSGRAARRNFRRAASAAVEADLAVAADRVIVVRLVRRTGLALAEKRDFHRGAVSEVAEAASAVTIGQVIVAGPVRRAVLVRAARRNSRRAVTEARIAAPVPAPGEEIAQAVRQEAIDRAVHRVGVVRPSLRPGERVPVQGSSVAGDHQVSRQGVRAAGREVGSVDDQEVAPAVDRVDVPIVRRGKER